VNTKVQSLVSSVRLGKTTCGSGPQLNHAPLNLGPHGPDSSSTVGRYFQAVATLLVDTDTSARQDLLRAIAWFPVTRLAPAAVHTAAFAWFWVMAAAPGLTVRAFYSCKCPTAFEDRAVAQFCGITAVLYGQLQADLEACRPVLRHLVNHSTQLHLQAGCQHSSPI